MVKGKVELEHFLSRVEGRKYRKFTTKLGKTKISVLELLSEGESYGYQIWQELAEKYGIIVKIPSVYQHLYELQNSGLIIKTRKMETFDKRKFVRLINMGKREHYKGPAGRIVYLYKDVKIYASTVVEQIEPAFE